MRKKTFIVRITIEDTDFEKETESAYEALKAVESLNNAFNLGLDMDELIKDVFKLIIGLNTYVGNSTWCIKTRVEEPGA